MAEFDWNDESVATLRALWLEGLSAAAVGRRLGISKNAVVGKVKRLNLPARPSPIIRGGDPSAGRRRKPRRATGATLAPLASVATPAPPLPPPAATRQRVGKVIPCCWPAGEPGTPGFRFCENPSLPGRPYCEGCCGKAYPNMFKPAAAHP